MKEKVVMNKGYQIIEPDQLVGLFGNPKHFEFAVAIFYWLVHELNTDPQVIPQGVEIEVIRVEYQGSYPALGVYYKEEDRHTDVEPQVLEAIANLLQKKSVLDLVRSIQKSEISWKELTDKLMDSH